VHVKWILNSSEPTLCVLVKLNIFMWFYVAMWNNISVYISIILYGHVKLCTCKKCEFYLGKGDFIVFLVIGQPNGPLQKQIIKTCTHNKLMDLWEGIIIRGI
jgi:hypothetical protein